MPRNSYTFLHEGKKPALLSGLPAAAEYLGVTVATLKQFIDADILNYIKLDRQFFFREDWLNEIKPTNKKKEEE